MPEGSQTATRTSWTFSGRLELADTKHPALFRPVHRNFTEEAVQRERRGLTSGENQLHDILRKQCTPYTRFT
jgi:hypothetical protein